MKLKLLFALGLGITTTFYSFSDNQLGQSLDFITTDTSKTKLSLYGAYIFKREGCDRCHSFDINDQQAKMSLDGLKGKYPKTWHYAHLIDPEAVVMRSSMPAFAFLTDNTFDKNSIDTHLGNISAEEWEKLIAEAKLIKNELSTFNADLKENSEMIALIAFLDQIPESEALQKIKAKESEKIAAENKSLDSLWANADNVILQAMNEKNSAKSGQQIFKNYCTPCHGKKGEGMVGPNLTDNYWLHGGSDKNIAHTIINGVPEKGMITWRNQLNPRAVGQLVSYIKSLKGTNPKNGKTPQGTKE